MKQQQHNSTHRQNNIWKSKLTLHGVHKAWRIPVWYHKLWNIHTSRVTQKWLRKRLSPHAQIFFFIGLHCFSVSW